MGLTPPLFPLHPQNLPHTSFLKMFSVYPWPLASGKNGQQVVDVLQKNVELAGAVWSNGWCVDCETYQSVASIGRCLFRCLGYKQ